MAVASGSPAAGGTAEDENPLAGDELRKRRRIVQTEDVPLASSHLLPLLQSSLGWLLAPLERYLIIRLTAQLANGEVA